jgi:hypothetical protein
MKIKNLTKFNIYLLNPLKTKIIIQNKNNKYVIKLQLEFIINKKVIQTLILNYQILKNLKINLKIKKFNELIFYKNYSKKLKFKLLEKK